jgi:hypothetical protein
MKNPRFNKMSSSTLALSFTLWSVGCYSSHEVTRLDPQSYPLEVVTKGNRRYTLERRWNTDSLGAISGDAQWHHSTEEDPLLLQGRVRLPIDSIASAYVEGNEILVVTKDKSRLTLSKWMSDGTGGIHGIMVQRNTAYSYDNWQVSDHIVSPRSIPADSILSIQKSEFSNGKTILLITGGAAAAGIVLFGIAVGNAFRDRCDVNSCNSK